MILIKLYKFLEFKIIQTNFSGHKFLELQKMALGLKITIERR